MTAAQHTSLDQRRGWARLSAVAACLAGVTVFALSAAALVMIGFAAAARFWSWLKHDSIVDSPVWRWAPGGAGALGALAIIVSFVGTFWHFWRGSTKRVLREVGARPLDPSSATQLVNVVEALSIGIGRTAPLIYVTDDPVPNALSLRSIGKRVLVVTGGCSSLTRDELEALAAHELGHLWANDAHWVTSGMVALARARRFGSLVLGLGTFLFVLVAGVAQYTDVVLWSSGVIAIVLIVLGSLAKATLRRLEFRVRHNADEIADVVAVRLAKNPASLGSLCVRLAENRDRVSRVGWRSELLWFESVETIEDMDEATEAAQSARSRRELIERAVKAYGEARVPLPVQLQAAR